MSNLPKSEETPMRAGANAQGQTSSRRRAHDAFPSDRHEQRRMYFRLTVGALTGAIFIGWLVLMKYTVRQGPPGGSPVGDQAARAEILANLRDIRNELQRIPSFGELVNQFTTQASSTEETLTDLASRIAGQATSTSTTTPQTATTTPSRLP